MKEENIKALHYCIRCKDLTPVIYREKKPHVGKFCGRCGAFIKWISKEEIERGKIKLYVQKELF
jgi:hypothetical protein